jgi:hypothetical protein
MTENPRVGSSILSQATIFIEEKDALEASFSNLCNICATISDFGKYTDFMKIRIIPIYLVDCR